MRECGKTGLAGKTLDYFDGLRLKGLPVKVIKVPGNQFLEAGTPDIHATVFGRSVWIELKVAGNQPKKIQQVRLNEWSAAGAVVGAAWSVDDVREILKSAFPDCEQL